MVNTASNAPLMTEPDAHRLALQLTQLATQYSIKTWCLAYSGGVDSQVLLHLLHHTRLDVRAIYIDHQLHSESSQWARHCAEQCEQMGIPFRVTAVDAQARSGESPEAAARTARYAALAECIEPGMCLLTAQHQDDQAETVLLQLLRGGGAAGLSAMPYISEFSQGWHCRPLLAVAQQSIHAYADQQGLSWVEDPSNQQQHYDRNYLRHTVIPALQARWPALNKTLSTFAAQQVEYTELLDQLAASDVLALLNSDNGLSIPQLKQLDHARSRNALRYWFKTQQVSMPSRAVLDQLLLQMQGSDHDTHACVSWGTVEVRRFRDNLFCVQPLAHDPQQNIRWSGAQPLMLHSLNRVLSLEAYQTDETTPYVLSDDILNRSLSVRFRQGGERIQPAGREGHRDLKSLFQEAAIPAWQRDKIPLIYADEQLVAVTGYWLADEVAKQGKGLLPRLVSISA